MKAHTLPVSLTACLTPNGVIASIEMTADFIADLMTDLHSMDFRVFIDHENEFVLVRPVTGEKRQAGGEQ